MSVLKQVKASAGSGKTYRLTRRFLSLLDGAGDDAHLFVCARGPRGRYGWPEILAVTFTNKAAAEMKERIVKGLKERALGLDPDRTPEDRQRASDMLRSVLRRYQSLNVRTIDSLLNQLLRLFALEAGIPPDFELSLETTPLFEEVFEGMLLAGAGERLEKALSAMLEGGSSTFWIHQSLRRDLLGLVDFVRELPTRPDTDQGGMADRLSTSRAAVLRALADLDGYVEELDLPLNSNCTKALDKLRSAGLFDPVYPSKMFTKESLAECVLKKGKPLVDERGEFIWLRFKDAFALHREEHGLLSQAYFLAPAVELATDLAVDMETLQAERGVILNSFLPAAINRLLRQGAVSEAFCRLGCRLHHLLVDEFQDTSRAQWGAVTPLAEECLAKGGSLFCVGDVKQAIYGWRGGDSTLFDEVIRQPGLAEVAETCQCETLPDNWRSFRRVVEFNNEFFARLEDPDQGAELVDELFADSGADFRATLAGDLNRAFGTCAQGVPDKHAATDGYVRFERLDAADASDLEEQSLDRLDGLLDDLGSRRPWRDVAVLVRNHTHATLVSDRLIERGIPVITEKSLRLDRHPVVRQLVAFLAFLDYPRNDHAFAEFAGGAEVFQGEAGLDRGAFTDWLLDAGRGGLGIRFKKDFPEQWGRLIEPFFNRSGLMAPYDLVRDMVEAYQVLERHPDAELYVRRLLEVVHLAENAGHGSLAGFLDYWRDHSGDERVPLPENVDAVRVMTIHKAKGLEFPVVIVPFHHWETRPAGDFLFRENMVVKVRAALGEPYQRAMGQGMLEDLNLLYVTWTRAREELYGFYPEKLARPPRTRAVLKVMNHFLDSDDDGVTAYGVRPATGSGRKPEPATPAPEVLPRTQPPELLAWLPRLRVYRHHQDEFGYNEARRGDAVHRAMEHISVNPVPARIPVAVAQAMADFPLLDSLDPAARGELETGMRDILAWALDHLQVGPWLASGANEVEIMGEDGEVFRIDRLHRADDGLYVIDWKTGQPDPKHQDQVRNYLDLLAGAGEPGPLSGYLVYLDLREVRQVTWLRLVKQGEGE